MGKKDKNKKKGKGAEKTAMKTDKKQAARQKKMLEKLGEANIADIIQLLEAKEGKIETISESVCLPPSPRSNFTLVSHPEKEELIMFGGELYTGTKTSVYNDLYFYNIKTGEWRELKSPSGPTPRSGHQMVAVASNGGELWMFGGEHASPSQLQFHHYKDLWKFSLKSRKWEKVSAPNGPSPRSGHRMTVSKKRLFIFGGFHDNNQSYHYFNDLHIFSLESYQWLKTEIGGTIVPSPRSGCCIAASPEGKIYVWGGYSRASMKKEADRGVTHTDMFVLSQDKNAGDADNKYKWAPVKAGGYKPKPRSSVGCTVAANGKAYTFGGVMDVDEDDEDVHGQFGDDLLAFDLTSQTWRLQEIQAKTSPAEKKETDESKDVEMSAPDKPVTTTTDGIFTVTVGGPSTSTPYVSNIPSLFPKAKPSNVPSPRMNPGLCVCKGTLYIFGGIFEEDAKQLTYNDFYSLDLHKLEWKVIIPNNLKAHVWEDSDSSSSDEECSSNDEDSFDDSDMDTD
ncbi:kelch domain-containing protein 4 [Drosophila elegans]|uniref:kelch domain-containing protein 4 n=1 Tax=Drosophila elegans TaxID=30023 RepID=UPI0007E7B866|nr:kelch domain-containing protein 4 [Drosophila elegans]